MRDYFLLLLLLAGNISFAQQGKRIEKFYTYNWKACDVSIARYYAAIEFKDSLWFRNDYYIRENKLQMKGAYKDSACKIAEGMFHYFHANGNLLSKGEYKSGKKEGLWLSYHSNMMMSDSAFYSKGQLIGIRQQWYANGYPMDSSVYDSDGKGVHINWFDNGNPASAGRSSKEMIPANW
jgi:antitoxin component YwqK of YwqJK toxin-antitoxin module